MPPAGFKTAIAASVRPQTQVLDRSATGVGHFTNYTFEKKKNLLNKPSFCQLKQLKQ
jgi:hypothetical protein